MHNIIWIIGKRKVKSIIFTGRGGLTLTQKRIPKPGDLYQHFKGNLYQILTVATHTESEEALVIYQALYGDFRTYARPLDMFLSEVEREKYPEVKQTYRFELIDRDNLGTKGAEVSAELPKISGNQDGIKEVSKLEHTAENTVENKIEIKEDGVVNPDLLAFLEANGYAEKLEILYSIRKRIDDRLMTDIELSLDLFSHEGSIDDRIEFVKNNLQTLARFECNRLR